MVCRLAQIVMASVIATKIKKSVMVSVREVEVEAQPADPQGAIDRAIATIRLKGCKAMCWTAGWVWRRSRFSRAGDFTPISLEPVR